MDNIYCECAQCGLDIYRSDTYFTDGDGNRFCKESCAIEYHGIKEADYESESESDKYEWRIGA